MEGSFKVKVYYEDTDAAGVVYYANYLRYLERARTELIDQLGPSVAQWASEGVVFPVYKVEITYRRPARLGDHCTVLTSFKERQSDYRITMQQRIFRDQELLVDATVQLVCVNPALSVQPFPAAILEHCPEVQS